MNATSQPDNPVPGGLEIRRESDGDRTVLLLTGELDIASAPSLDRALEEAGSVDGPMVIDLSGVVFMDSTGLRALVLARGKAEEAGRRLALRRGPHQVQRVFELSGMLDSFNFES